MLLSKIVLLLLLLLIILILILMMMMLLMTDEEKTETEVRQDTLTTNVAVLDGGGCNAACLFLSGDRSRDDRTRV